MIAGLDPRGLEAMSRSHEAKKARFDYLHALHHAYEDAKAEKAGRQPRPVTGPRPTITITSLTAIPTITITGPTATPTITITTHGAVS